METLLSVAGLKAGDAFSPEAEEKAFRRLVRYPYLSSVEPPTEERLADGSIDIVFRIRERSVIGDVRIAGSDALDAAGLLAEANLSTGQPLTEAATEAARDAILARYHREGFLLTSVDAKVEPAGDGRVNITFSVTEGEKVRLRDVELEGAEKLPASESLNVIGIRPRRLFGLLSGGFYVPEDLDAELEKLHLHYVSHGFLSAVVGFCGLDFDGGFRTAVLKLCVSEGPRYLLAAVRVEKSKIFPDKTLEEAAAIPTGDFYSSEAVERGRDRLLCWYEQHSDRIPRIRIHNEYGEGDRVTVVFEIEEEMFLEVGEVEIRGNRLTRDRVLRKNVTLIPGKPFAPSEVRRTRERLEASGICEKVEIGLAERADPQRPDTRSYDVDIQVKEPKSFGQLIQLGGEASSGSGVVGQLEIQRANFDLFRLPRAWDDWKGAFTGGGQYLDFRLAPGTQQSVYSLLFVEPYFFRSDLALSIQGGLKLYDWDTYDENRLGGSVTLEKFFDGDHRWSAALSYVGERVRISDLDKDAPPDAIAVEGDTVLSYPRLELRCDLRELNFYSGPKGFFASARMDLALTALGSDVSFVRGAASANYYLHLFDDRPDYRHILHAGVNVLWMEGLDGSDVPLFEKFYLGGPATFRGFQYRRLGPAENGTPVGGQGGLHGTLEYSFPLVVRELRGVAVLDWGDLEPTFSEISTDRFRLAAGGGLEVRIKLLGQLMPANFYWVKAITSEPGDRLELFSFTLGLNF